MSTVRSGEPLPLALRHPGAVTLSRVLLSEAAVEASEARRANQPPPDTPDDRPGHAAVPRLDAFA